MRRLIIALLLIAPYTALADDELIRLRAEYALHFLDSHAHLRLSKHLMAKGDRLTAFFISEAARRSYFGEDDFNRAFSIVFRDDHFDNSAGAEKQLLAELAATPDDPAKRDQLADIFLSRSEWKKAEAELRTAIKLAPDTFTYAGGLAEVLRRDGRKTEADELMKAWVESHPASLEAYRLRLESLISGKSPEAGKVLDTALAAYPDDATLHYMRANILQTAGDAQGAAKEYSRAAELDPKSAFIQGWIGRFFLKVMRDNERALQQYLNAYFQDPHFYDSEFAEERIRSIAMERGQARYKSERGRGVAIAKLMVDSDPVIVSLALVEAGRNWSDDLATPVIALLGHDDPNVRYGAPGVLAIHLKADDERIARLLQDSDLRVRSAAAYAAGVLNGEKIVPLMVSWLDHPSELIRYDAISVLGMQGGRAGRDELLKLRKAGKVTEPLLRTILDMAVDAKNAPVAKP